MSTPYPRPATNPALPSVTVVELLKYGRLSLLDDALGPVVPSPGAQGTYNSRLQEVRLVGDSDQLGDVEIGTLNWVPGRRGWPWAVLSAQKSKKDPHKEAGRVWEDWRGVCIIGLSDNNSGTTALKTWADYWDAVLTQWFALHRRFGQPILQAGDVYWELLDTDQRQIPFNGISCFALICILNIHNVVVAPWGI